ncbi:hypothetical protein [Streptomyces sp. NPDC048603]|uniref:hypothetical protein n=1 Tax=Streptomyces sp. NPDC048603 TaxID=3365577 RepID=UPI00371957AD
MASSIVGSKRPGSISAALLPALLLASLTACSAAEPGQSTAPTPVKPPVVSTEPTASAEEQAEQQVVAAYRGFHTVTSAAFQTGQLNDAELRKYARDKAHGGAIVSLEWLRERKLKVVGQDSISPRVTAIDLAGDPKTATVSDCRDTSGTDTVYKSTGESALKPDSKEPRRKPVTAKAVAVDGRWLISDYEIDRTRTC